MGDSATLYAQHAKEIPFCSHLVRLTCGGAIECEMVGSRSRPADVITALSNGLPSGTYIVMLTLQIHRDQERWVLGVVKEKAEGSYNRIQTTNILALIAASTMQPISSGTLSTDAGR